MTHGSPFQHILCPRYWEDDLVSIIGKVVDGAAYSNAPAWHAFCDISR